MTVEIAERAVETSLTEGSVNDFELEGKPIPPAVDFGVLTFIESVGDQTGTSDEVIYGVQEQGSPDFEIYRGQIRAGAGAGGKDLLTRGTLLLSSTGARIAWGGGGSVRSIFGTLSKLTQLLAANNLSDLNSAPTARTNLGATAVGDDLFTAVDAAAGRTALALGTAATRTVGSDADAKLMDRGQSDARNDGRYAAIGHSDHATLTEAGFRAIAVQTDGRFKIALYSDSTPRGFSRVTGVSGAVIRLEDASAAGTSVTSGREDVAFADTEDHVLAEAEMPAHTHSITVKSGSPVGGFSEVQGTQDNAVLGTEATESTGGGGGHSHQIKLKYSNFGLYRFDGA